MRIILDRCGLYVVFRFGTPERRAIGFKIVWGRPLLFSEREGYARGFKIGPLWVGTYGQRKRLTPTPRIHGTSKTEG